MSDVVPLRPGAVLPLRQAPDRRVVTLCEALLAQALSGRVRTLAVASLVAGDEPGLRPVLRWVDAPEHAMALSGAAAKLAREIAET
ncbi:hypothetical protein [Lichenibacterium dinghuense]|uniref:hypothetical protein n=1 Tax=Lichenibacterium dinghuense TaxID=2895977 RepID=UPI001F3B12CC|nr:hypothetical protein [Lichenibacterium sp. 6Y81]